MHALSSTDYGVGARLSVAVMTDNYAEVILSALAVADGDGLDITTDDVSTYLSGDESRILQYVSTVIAQCARSGHHVNAHLLLSRGCPGEVTCALPPEALAQGADAPQLPAIGIPVAAHWSLYPLHDGGADADHMREIYAAIDHARNQGVEVRSEHLATRLAGDLNHVLQTIASAWLLVGREVQHVVSHATLSLNSPTVVAR